MLNGKSSVSLKAFTAGTTCPTSSLPRAWFDKTAPAPHHSYTHTRQHMLPYALSTRKYAQPLHSLRPCRCREIRLQLTNHAHRLLQFWVAGDIQVSEVPIAAYHCAHFLCVLTLFRRAMHELPARYEARVARYRWRAPCTGLGHHRGHVHTCHVQR
jgi:hypothetical protein